MKLLAIDKLGRYIIYFLTFFFFVFDHVFFFYVFVYFHCCFCN